MTPGRSVSATLLILASNVVLTICTTLLETDGLFAEALVSTEPVTASCGSDGYQIVRGLNNKTVTCTSCRKSPVSQEPQVLISGSLQCEPGSICQQSFNIPVHRTQDAPFPGWRDTYTFEVKGGNSSGQLLYISHYGIGVRKVDNQFMLQTGTGQYTGHVFTTSDAWYHVALQLSNVTAALFVNGTFYIAEGIEPITIPEYTLSVGAPLSDGLCEPLQVPKCQEVGFSAFVKPRASATQADVEANGDLFLDIIDNSLVSACGQQAPPEFPFDLSICFNLTDTNCVSESFVPDNVYFIGSLRDVTYYPMVLTNRDIARLVNGEPPPPAGTCVCPETHPKLIELTQCSKNPSSQIVKTVDTAKYTVDFNLNTSWISNPRHESVAIIIDLEEEIMINQMYIWPTDFSPVPDGINIEVESSLTSEWRQYATLSTTCSDQTEIGIPDDVWRWYITWVPENAKPCYLVAPQKEMRTWDIVAETNGWKYVQNASGELIWFDNMLRNKILANRVRLTFTPPSTHPFVDIASIGAIGVNIRPSSDFCNCHPVGVLDQGRPCNDRGECVCLAGGGADSPGDCAPRIESMHPLFGPVSGGTWITLIGSFLKRPTESTPDVHLLVIPQHEQRRLRVEFRVDDSSNSTHIFAQSSKINDTIHAITDIPGTLKVTWNSSQSATLFTESLFTYRPDPVIDSISPRSSIVEGGIEQTVKGMHLDSVSRPQMTIYYWNSVKDITQAYSDCTVVNSTVMVCPTPHIINQGNSPLPTRRRRQTSSRPCTNENALLNCDDRRFYLGFRLDGVTKYRNASEALGDQGTIFIWKTPDIQTFEQSYGSDEVTFSTYQGAQFLRIQGNGLCRSTPDGPFPNTGCDLKDYVVTVGRENATVNEVLTNTVRFSPPPTKPEADFGRGGSPDVKIQLGTIRLHIGYIRYEESWWDNPVHLYGVIGGACGLVVLIILIVIIICCCRHRQKYPHISREIRYRHPFDDPAYQDHRYSRQPISPGADLFASLEDDLKVSVQQTLIDTSLIDIGKQIGKGQFGEVYAGTYHDGNEMYPVAVKTCKKGSGFSDMAEFLVEGTMMKDCSHENVLGLIGTFFKDGRPYVILPLMENGDLKTFISMPQNTFTVLELVEFGYQVARGMEYLAAQKIVHRDLAARNCMINKDMLVKVADFGLARDIYEKEYYAAQTKHRPLPIKWMAIETLEDFKATTASDVWSFGVTLWELLTRGMKPYPDVDALDLKRFLKSGRRLEKPVASPPIVYQLMYDCWNAEPEARPSFEEIVGRLEAMILPVSPELPQYRQDYVKRNAIANNPYSKMAYHAKNGPDNVEALRDKVQTNNEYLDVLRQPAQIGAGVDENYLPAKAYNGGYLDASSYLNMQ